MSFFKSVEKPLLIAGPCSAETRDQVFETAEGLKGLPVSMYRAGVWKPRTRPGHFEGVGLKALQWLEEMSTHFKLPYCIEVAEPNHIEAALKHKAAALWIGARTTVNPFQVQRLADALKGINIPILIKNPVNPDAELWLGAIERIEGAGIKDIAAVHRGFSTYKASSPYRNTPNWPVAIELRRRRPDLPILCDPSHIAGNATIVAEVAQKAMDMAYDGLMIEVHPNPGEAWSDAAQQLTPEGLKVLLENLVIRQEYTADSRRTELDFLRQLMDSVDAEVIDLLARRMELTERIGLVKKDCNMTAFQEERYNEIVRTRGDQAEALNMQKEFIVEIFEKIHHVSVKRQLEILKEG